MLLTREEIKGQRGTWAMSNAAGADWSTDLYEMRSEDGSNFYLSWIDKATGKRTPGDRYTANTIHTNWRFASIGCSNRRLLLLEKPR